MYLYTEHMPSSANQQRGEITNFKFLDNGPTTTNFPYFYLELNAFVAYSSGASFNTDKHTETIYVNVKLQSKDLNTL